MNYLLQFYKLVIHINNVFNLLLIISNFNGHRLMVDRSSSKRCAPIRIRLAVLYY